MHHPALDRIPSGDRWKIYVELSANRFKSFGEEQRPRFADQIE
jgi:hypothetical protein